MIPTEFQQNMYITVKLNMNLHSIFVNRMNTQILCIGSD